MLPVVRSMARHYESRVVPFLGLNRSADTRPGQFSHQKNLAPRSYPWLTPRATWAVEQRPGAHALFSWDGVPMVAAQGQLWWGEQVLCNLTDGPKQFAVVNSGLVVWPDGLVVDLKQGTVTPMAARAVNRGNATFTANSLTMDVRTACATTTLTYRAGDGLRPWIWTYGRVAWEEGTGWTLEDGAWSLPGTDCVGRYYIPAVTQAPATQTYTAQLHQAQFQTRAPEQAGQPGNEVGVYGQITGVEELFVNIYSFYAQLSASIYRAGEENQPFYQLFRPGDVVSVSGTPGGYWDVEQRAVEDIDRENNRLIFAGDVFAPGTAVAMVTQSMDKQSVCCVYTDDGGSLRRYGVTDLVLEAGQRVVLDVSGPTFTVQSREKDGWTQTAQYTARSVTSAAGLRVLTMDYLPTTQARVEVVRPIPQLDYICQHDNRLWGVCSATNTIHASALGDPLCFYTYAGLSTDSWTQAVGSDGAFTGLCSYSGAVLCWKQGGLHKVLGTLPENYQLVSYTLPGPRQDSSKSLVECNGALYYLGRDGVYAYTGSNPRRISQVLGEGPMSNGVGGTDGKCYYLSAKRGDTGWELLLYDTADGLWFGWDAVAVTDFCRSGEGLMYLAGEELCTPGLAGQAVEWEGVLCPFYSDLDRRQYRRVTLRARVEPGSELRVHARFDGGGWQLLGRMLGRGEQVSCLPLPQRRCRRLELKLSGRGECAVMELACLYSRKE